MEPWHDALHVAEYAAREAGQLLRSLQFRVAVREKGPADLVTEADLAAQNLIQSRLHHAFPHWDFLGEESPLPDSGEKKVGAPIDRADWLSAPDTTAWIVDPLDGTTNFIHGLDNYSVSIALVHRGALQLGVVFDPVREQMFSAIRGAGATYNGERMQVSHTQTLRDALISASFAARVPPDSPEVARFVAVLHRAQAVRRLGSAALNLAYVAAGKLDGYWATSVQAWDIAAGWLLVQEAGGVLRGIDGAAASLARPQFVAAATDALQQEMLDVLQQATRSA